MAVIVCPGADWKYSYNDSGESSSVTFSNTGKIKVSIPSMEVTDVLEVYNTFEDGESITDDNRIVIDMKSSIPPSRFEAFELFVEDCNGNKATYSIDNDMLGKSNQIITHALVKGEDFNASFVTRFGVRLSHPTSDKPFTLIISDLHTVYRVEPSYAQPQEVIELLGMVDNKGQPFVLTDSSVPSYNAIAKRICESEDFIEGNCRDAWAERRVENEIRNADTAWNNGSGYMGLLSSDGVTDGMQTYFKGIPIKLVHDKILPIDYSKGDKVEVRRYGANWSTLPEGMVWADLSKGIIYIRTIFFQNDASVRVTYRYGHGPVPGDVKEATLLRTAMLVVGTDWYRQRFPNSGVSDPLKQEWISQVQWRVKECIRNHCNTIEVGGM